MFSLATKLPTIDYLDHMLLLVSQSVFIVSTIYLLSILRSFIQFVKLENLGFGVFVIQV